MHFHQPLVADHADGEADIRQLHQQQPEPEVLAELIVTNNRRANHSQQRAERIAPAQRAAAEQVVNQRDIQWRQNGKQQELGNRQIEISPEAEQVHHTQLERAHQHIQGDDFRFQSLKPQERQKHQSSQPNAHQHGKIAVDMPGKVFANQAKGKGPQNSGDNE